MKMGVPEFMPVLSAGAHDNPQDGACIMEMVSFLAGEDFSDNPACTDPTLAAYARIINDSISDQDRHLLIPLIGRLFGTSLGGRFSFGLIYGTVADFRPAIGRFLRAGGDVGFAAIIEDGPIDGPYCHTAAVTTGLVNAVSQVAFLSALIDEFDRMTGRTEHRHLTDADYRDLVALTK